MALLRGVEPPDYLTDGWERTSVSGCEMMGGTEGGVRVRALCARGAEVLSARQIRERGG